MAETDVEAGASLAGQLTDFLHFLQRGGWKPWQNQHTRAHWNTATNERVKEWKNKLSKAKEEKKQASQTAGAALHHNHIQICWRTFVILIIRCTFPLSDGSCLRGCSSVMHIAINIHVNWLWNNRFYFLPARHFSAWTGTLRPPSPVSCCWPPPPGFRDERRQTADEQKRCTVGGGISTSAKKREASLYWNANYHFVLF